MKKGTTLLKNLTLLSQLGLSLVMPLLICMGICYLLTSRLGAGSWVYILGFFFGLGGSGMTAYKTYLAVMKKEEKKDGEKRAAFNSHH